MRVFVSLIALAISGGTATAQPADGPPGGYAEPSPPVEAQPPQPQAPPPGSTRATFVSTSQVRWDVRIDDNAVCTTPCSIMVEPVRFVTLHSHDLRSERVNVGYMPPGDVLVQAKPRSQGAFAAGVTFTALTGMGLATGITLTAVGCSTDRSGMCNAGLITGVASGLGLYLSIDLIRKSLPRVQMGPARPYATGSSIGVAGTF